MDARYCAIRAGHEQAEQVTDDAREAVAQYEAQLATIRAEAQQRIEAARATLEAERAEQLTEVNARIAEKRAAAATRSSRPARPPRPTSRPPCGPWPSRAGELATGRTPDPQVVNDAVAEVMSAGVTPMIAVPSPRCSSRSAEHRHRRQGLHVAPLAVPGAGRADLRHAGLGHHPRPPGLEGRSAGQEGVQRPHRQGAGRARRLGAGADRRRRRGDPHPPGARRHRRRAAAPARRGRRAGGGAARRRPGRGSTPRSPSSRPRPTPTSVPPAAGCPTSCATRSPGWRRPPPTGSSSDSLDDATQQRLVEDYIQRVGASA